MSDMFCFQCEQTAGYSGCTGMAGVCGKSADTAILQDKLTGALIGLARSVNGNEPTASTHRAMLEGLFATITNVSFGSEAIRRQIDAVHKEKNALVPQCACCASHRIRDDDYDMNRLWQDNEDVRSLKSLILFGLRGMAAYAYHALMLGYTDDDVNRARVWNCVNSFPWTEKMRLSLTINE